MKKILKDLLWLIAILFIIVVIATSCTKTKDCGCTISTIKYQETSNPHLIDNYQGFTMNGNQIVYFSETEKEVIQSKKKSECSTFKYKNILIKDTFYTHLKDTIPFWDITQISRNCSE